MQRHSQTPLQTAVQQAFAVDGPLALNNPQYVPRSGQRDMAVAVAEVLESRGRLVVEAGTGIGKTFAYLVPALLSGRQVVVCTATKTLQDQLFGRDLPQVAVLLGVPLRAALLKGRSNYLCLQRLAHARDHVLDHDRHAQAVLRQVEEWAVHTTDGDLSDAGVLLEQSPLWPLVTSTRENCLGSGCPRVGDCHVFAARRRAASADVVVANHHLFWADRQVREVADTGLLPNPHMVVFDEAHHLVDTAARYLADTWSANSCREWGRDTLRWAARSGAGVQHWTALVTGLEMALSGVQFCLPEGQSGAEQVLVWEGGQGPKGLDANAWWSAYQSLQQALQQLLQVLTDASDGGPLASALCTRGEGLLHILQVWADGCGRSSDSALVSHACWVACSRPFRLVRAPLNLDKLFAQGPDEPALIFTSATLGAGDDLTWLGQTLGLEGHTRLRIPSPFDHARVAGLYVPTHLPLPEDPSHLGALARCVWPWVQRLRGRTLVLTTTTRAVQQVADAFGALQSSPVDPRILVQGAGSKTELLERFRAACTGDGAVLVATSSFWEGVDLRGDVLQLLVIDKLPFPPPDDPWLQARGRADNATGRSTFRSTVLPAVAVALRQGVGRLIRSETDQGLLVIGDRRLVQRSYGAYLRRALPPMAQLGDEHEVLAWVDSLVTPVGLTTPSTMDRSWV